MALPAAGREHWVQRRFVFRNVGCYHPVLVGEEELAMADRDGNGFLWFLAGLGLGAVVGVLYAPLAGSETRRTIRAKAEEGSEYVRARAREAREQAQQWADRGRDALKQQKEQFRSAYEAGRQAYHEATTPESSAGSPKNV